MDDPAAAAGPDGRRTIPPPRRGRTIPLSRRGRTIPAPRRDADGSPRRALEGRPPGAADDAEAERGGLGADLLDDARDRFLPEREEVLARARARQVPPVVLTLQRRVQVDDARVAPVVAEPF